MNNIVLVSEVAALSKQRPHQSDEDLKIDSSFDTSESPQKNSKMSAQPDVRSSSLFYNSLNDSQRQLILQQLESWEEPVVAKNNAIVSYRCYLYHQCCLADYYPWPFLSIARHKYRSLPFFSSDRHYRL